MLMRSATVGLSGPWMRRARRAVLRCWRRRGGSRRNKGRDPIPDPSARPRSPHVSTTVCSATCRRRDTVIGQVIPYRGFLPVPAAWMRRGLFVYSRQTLVRGGAAIRTTEHRLERLEKHNRRLTAAPLDRARLRSRRSLGPRLRSEHGGTQPLCAQNPSAPRHPRCVVCPFSI